MSFFLFVLWGGRNRVLLCRPGWPQAYRDLPAASTSSVLRSLVSVSLFPHPPVFTCVHLHWGQEIDFSVISQAVTTSGVLDCLFIFTAVCACLVAKEPEEGIISPGTGVPEVVSCLT